MQYCKLLFKNLYGVLKFFVFFKGIQDEHVNNLISCI